MLPPPIKSDKGGSERSDVAGVPALNVEQIEAQCIFEETTCLSGEGQGRIVLWTLVNVCMT